MSNENEIIEQQNVSSATEQPQQSVPATKPAAFDIQDDERKYTLIAYVCYILSLFTGFAGIVGLIIAYVKRNDIQNPIYASHITYLIRTFWISFIGMVVGILTVILLIGYLIILAVGIWYIYRLIKGAIRFFDNEPVDALSWF